MLMQQKASFAAVELEASDAEEYDATCDTKIRRALFLTNPSAPWYAI